MRNLVTPLTALLLGLSLAPSAPAGDRLAARLIERHLRLPGRRVVRPGEGTAALVALVARDDDDDWRGKAERLRSVPGGRGWGRWATSRCRPSPASPRPPTTPAPAAGGGGCGGGGCGGGGCGAGGPASGSPRTWRPSPPAARRCNPAVRAFAARPEAAGKCFKVVITACMRKLLIPPDAMLKADKPWEDRCPAAWRRNP